MAEELTHLSLFSGIGGIDIAAEWAGFETVGQCEFADYPTKVLEKHWPDVPRWRDIRSVTADSFRDRTGLRTVDLISGGFPCQPFSVAGNQKGKGDERYLWPEMLRVIRELKPRWVLGENVPGIVSIAGRTVCEDLEREGYDIAVFNFEAAAVGAPHRRERIFFVANAESRPRRVFQQQGRAETTGTSENGADWPTIEMSTNVAYTYAKRQSQQEGRIEEIGRRISNSSKDVADATSEQDRRLCQSGLQPDIGASGNVADANNEGLQVAGYEPGIETLSSKNGTEYIGCVVDGDGGTGTWWSVEPDVGRVATGIPSRVDRLKCLGNAVVPQQAFPIFKAIADIETGMA